MTPEERGEWFISPKWADPQDLPRCVACRRAVTRSEWWSESCPVAPSGHVLTGAQITTLPYTPLELEERI